MGEGDLVVPVVEERAAILKRKVLTEGVRVRTAVHEREAVVDEPLVSEEVEVERVLLDRWVDAPIPVRQDGDTTVITLVEEVVVVEKRLRLSRPDQRRILGATAARLLSIG